MGYLQIIDFCTNYFAVSTVKLQNYQILKKVVNDVYQYLHCNCFVLKFVHNPRILQYVHKTMENAFDNPIDLHLLNSKVNTHKMKMHNLLTNSPKPKVAQ